MKIKPTKASPFKKFAVFIVVILTLFGAIFLASGSILKSLYPLHYDEFVEVYAKENNLSPFFVYAVIKCESGFDKDAVSYADARGLMQLLPSSFLWLTKKTGESLPENMMLDPETSIKYGCYFYGILFKEFENEREALAAYHAGQGNVRKWLKNEKYSSDGKTLCEIPFGSTREYVHKVMTTKVIYEKIYS